MTEYQTKFYQNDDGFMIVHCLFGVDARVGSNTCEWCKSFIKDVMNKRISRDIPIQGTVYCYGGEKNENNPSISETTDKSKSD
jgi:hypothetical protein